MQGQPMKDLVGPLPLSDAIRQALLGVANRERALLSWIESCERAAWPAATLAAESAPLNQQQLSNLYLEAVAWAEAALHTGS
jgi:c-di-GMP-related signal transduction protein